MKKFNKVEPSSVWIMIKQSANDHLGKASSTRINGYWMSILFTLCVLCSIGIEISSAISASHVEGETYSVSGQLLAICTLILGQQALLFNLKRKAEDTPFPTVENLNSVDIQNNDGGKINIPNDMIDNLDVKIDETTTTTNTSTSDKKDDDKNIDDKKDDDIS